MDKIAVWNVRGINIPSKHIPVRDFMVEHKLAILVLLETRVRKEKAQSILNSCGLGMNCIDNYDYARNGRIWLLWSEERISVQLLFRSSQIVHSLITFKSNGSQFLLSAVYAENEATDRGSLWQDLADIANTSSIPWLVAGDFNTMLEFGEKINDGDPVSFDNSELLGCTSACKLQDMSFSGDFFTWCNRREGYQRTYCKLDRVLVNEEWLSAYPASATVFSSNVISDHSNAVISISELEVKKRSFKFCNMWTRHPEFQEVVQRAWQTHVTGNPMYVLVKKMKAVKIQLQQMHKIATQISNRGFLICNRGFPPVRGRFSLILGIQNYIIKRNSFKANAWNY